MLSIIHTYIHACTLGDQASKLQAFADSNWAVTRSVTGFVIMLAGASILAVSRRQHCITMSSQSHLATTPPFEVVHVAWKGTRVRMLSIIHTYIHLVVQEKKRKRKGERERKERFSEGPWAKEGLVG